MNESNFFKPEDQVKKEPTKIEAGLDIKIKKLKERQDELMEALEKSYDVFQLLDDDPEAQQLERENIAPLRQEYLENIKLLGELDEKYKQMDVHSIRTALKREGIDSDAFFKAVFAEEDNDNK